MASIPQWLTKRGAEVKTGRDGQVWTIYFAGQPQYLVEPLPAKGKFTCRVLQTINGKRYDKGGVYATGEEAIQGGLEDLREALGW